LRVVFNGSSRTNTGTSLNECLHVGPKLQTDLDAVLLRWRTYLVAFAADIEKMYRQIQVHSDDRDFQRILWSDTDTPEEYQLCTVTYGLTCAPYLALRVIKQLAIDEDSKFPLAVDILRTEIYIDDILSGAATPHIARLKVTQLTELLKAGGFRLQKWASNDETILSDLVEPSKISTSREFQTETRTLGLVWQPANDSFKFHASLSDSTGLVTKRSILSRISQLFDPLRWLAPVTITGKIFIQQLWKAQVGWDDPLPPSLSQQWTTFNEELKGVTEFSIPRWLGCSSSSSGIELHGFSDASQNALGAVIYLRTLHGFADATVVLITAKSKVAPVKKQTIPRLELSAAVLLVRLLARVRQSLGYQYVPAHFWTDSTVSLVWIQGNPSRWKEFIANRVAAVQELVPDARWHHVAGADNPADCVTRGLSPSQLRQHSLWWNGPSWLQGPSVGWPTTTPLLAQSIDLEERRLRVLRVSAVSTQTTY